MNHTPWADRRGRETAAARGLCKEPAPGLPPRQNQVSAEHGVCEGTTGEVTATAP